MNNVLWTVWMITIIFSGFALIKMIYEGINIYFLPVFLTVMFMNVFLYVIINMFTSTPGEKHG